MRHRNGTVAVFANNTVPASILDYDQINQVVTRNRTFLRDFVLVIASLVIFVMIVTFIALIYNIQKSLELQVVRKQKLNETLLANYDYRTRNRIR